MAQDSTQKRDYYEVLGVGRDVAADDLKKSYRKLAMEFHPDRNPGDKKAEEKFKELSEAYEVLSDPQKKQMYDRFGHAGMNAQGPGGFGGFSGGGAESINDIFGDIFGDLFGAATGQRGGRGGGRRSRARQGSDLETSVDITFEEAFKGCEKIISINKHISCTTCSGSGAKAGTQPETCKQCNGRGEVTFQQGFFAVSRPCTHCQGVGQVIKDPCSTCRGSGRTKKTSQLSLSIPAGIDSGQRIRATGEGEPGEHGGPAGDLYVSIHVLDHEFFKRDGAEIICDIPITFVQAALGDEIEVPTLDGRVKMKIPTGTQSHKIFRLKGKGLTRLGSYGRGDQLCRVIVEIPSKLSKEQTALLKQFDESAAESNCHPLHKGFFDRVKTLFD